MTLIRRNNPFGEMLSLRQAMDRLVEDSLIRPGALLRLTSPKAEEAKLHQIKIAPGDGQHEAGSN